jgi:hypothetical protein
MEEKGQQQQKHTITHKTLHRRLQIGQHKNRE